MGFARGRDLMQRAARQAAAERGVDGRNAERHDAGAVFDAGRFFQRPQALAKLGNHI